ncbi:SusC/RagA family TonB-linked outer membrane protein [Flavivirga spongiicola]|uniref:SusC/RagA family TonB-linked outer membrane protein n=1 Tax=Flavivirga spongiicola TaxID=421621 RepID=A0ABU7XM25_9FLAO|nr:SusC/RagA family TonB-linked outer membrane protein [Flavivirga sp. MEBiC05379]MDO5981027.1 SusC/RagA family TonB-linked outer membrane protein [Flavivirga sp. MEBiC05379]MDO5981464.1 SusC/RagA family TonB-linked outer membrane protein [Flavivirga sp. MEBiC05379]
MEVTVDRVFDIINTQTGYSFIYHQDLFKDHPKVVLEKGVFRVKKLLKLILPTEDLNITVTKNTISISGKESGPENQGRSLTGTVLDHEGLPLSGATVLIKGSNKGTPTDSNGRFTIAAAHPEDVLVFSSLGFETQETTIGNQGSIHVSLKEAVEELKAVEIVGHYYKRSQEENPGSVYRLDAKTIERQPVTNPLAAMNGYIPGVNIVQSTGLSGGGFKIEIRGKNFIDAGTEPLYVLDGVPYSSESLSFPLVNPVLPEENPLSLINPADVEGIEVLKDADATAIYGSRGANGVVLITTKRGRAGKTQIKVNTTTGLASVSRFVDLLNTDQYLEMRLEALTNGGFTPGTTPPSLQLAMPDLFGWDPSRYTDWQKELIGGTAYRNTGQLSFSGGNEQTQFLFSGSYLNETTVFPGNSKYGKASVQSNINHRSQDGRFRVNVLTNYVVDDNRLPLGRLTQEAYRLAPNAPALYNGRGGLNWNGWGIVDNPLRLLEGEYRAKSKNFLLSTAISYRPVPGLELTANLGYTDYHKDEYKASRHTMFNPVFKYTSATGSSLFTNRASRQSWNMEPQVEWQKKWGNADLNILVGTTFQQRLTKQVSILGEGFENNNQILDISAANRITGGTDRESKYNYQAVFGRLNLKWAGKYIVNLTGRQDGSSRFGPGKQFGDFGAVGAAWIFSREAFLEDQELLSYGKLRTSYGVTGSDNIGDYGFYNSYGISSTGNYNGSVLLPSRLFNPAFGWEETKKFEVGLELGLLGDRVQLTTAWYKNRSTNQLLGVPLPGTTGFNSVNANFDATVENTGLEIDFRSVNLKSAHFKWTTTFNISVPKNKLVKFDGLEHSTFADQYVVGQPLSIRKLYHMTGVDPDTGVYRFEDYNKDGAIDPGASSEDRQWIEDTAPRFHGGLGNNFNYKALSLKVFFQFKKQRGPNISHDSNYPGDLSNQHASVLDRWQQAGDEVPVQRYTTGLSAQGAEAITVFPNYLNSSARYTDTSFIRLRNVSLIYSIPKGSISGLDARIYLQGQNLLTITRSLSADPEHFSATELPILRRFTLGLELGF